MKGEKIAGRALYGVILVAGIGTILEWFDFYIYTQLSSVLTKVFFPSDDPTVQALSYWGVFAAAFVVRPIGALIFGHIGDTAGRSKTLTLAIICMAVPTVIIGCLPTYGVGSYTAWPPILAPIFLALMRMVQGLAMGGEFGAAVIYCSELATEKNRGLYVTLLQCTVNIGMILATILVMILENSISQEQMLIWGWRIPFLLASCTALLGFFLRRGMPEPHAFLEAARAEKALAAADDVEAISSLKGSGKTFNIEAAPASFGCSNANIHTISSTETAEEGTLSRFHGISHSKTPLFRLLKNNWLGLITQIAFMAWVSGAFYLTVSWLMAGLKKTGTIPLINCQGMLIVSLLFNALGLVGVGKAFDKGMRAINANAVISIIGMCSAFGVYYGVWKSEAAAWCLMCLMQLIIGAAMAIVVLPCTRIYDPLERTSGFSFGYNCGYGVVGGLSPMIVTAIKASLPAAQQVFAPGFWLLALGGVSLIGCGMLRAYMPRINSQFIGHLE